MNVVNYVRGTTNGTNLRLQLLGSGGTETTAFRSELDLAIPALPCATTTVRPTMASKHCIEVRILQFCACTGTDGYPSITCPFFSATAHDRAVHSLLTLLA